MSEAQRDETSPGVGDGPLAQWRDQLNAGRFMLQRCNACSRHVFYPRVICPHCKADSLDWVEAGGGASVYSSSTVTRRPENGGNYNVSLIDLDEGVRMMSRVDGVAPDGVVIGMRVRASIARDGGEALVVFKPV